MKRLMVAALACGLFAGCTARWIGRPVSHLEKEFGRPNSIRSVGQNQIYVYPDILAGRGQMTFVVDRNGIIREWNAATTVDGVFAGDVFGDGLDANGDLGAGTLGGTRPVVLGP
jgi:hypothetical protein